MNKNIFFLINFISILFVIINFLIAGDDISFDRIFYVEFIKEISKLDFINFKNKLIDGFPYFSWADFGRFESGFAVLVYALSFLMDSELVWAVVALASLALKLSCMLKFNVNIFKIYLTIIASIVLFETNALRAGIAGSLIMMAIVFHSKNKSYLFLFFSLLACSFHLSAIVVVMLIYFGFYISKSRLNIVYIIISICISSLLAVVLPFIAKFSGGKLNDYYIQSYDFGLYGGASGFNVASIICIILFIGFGVLIIDSKNQLTYFTGRQYATVGCLISGVCASMLLLSGPFAIVGDRVWQLVLMPLIMLHSFNNSKSQKFIGVILIPFLIFYVIVNLLIRYPQSNFFVPIVPVVELISPTVY